MNLQSIKMYLVGLLLVLVAGNLNAQTMTPRYNTSMTSNTNGYYEYLPQGYSSAGTTLYPLIIFSHGIKEYGDGSSSDLWMARKCGPFKVVKDGLMPTSFTVNGKTYKFIMIAPQWKSGASVANVNGVIDYALKHYKVDPKRIYLTGLSIGGGVVENTVADPTVGKRIAAVVEFCGTGSPSITRATSIVNNNVAFWGIHNKSDTWVSSSKTINWVADILAIKSTFPVRRTIPSGTSHDCWSTRYVPTWTQDGLNIYQWMLQFSRGTTTTTTTTNTPPVATAGSDQTIYIPSTKVTLSGKGTDANGSISKYSWTKVSGPSSYSFSSTTSATPTVSSLVAGTYVFRLTVTDNGGATDYDDVTVNVKSPIAVPGKVEAELYSAMSGIHKEATSDGTSGWDVGYIDGTDWMTYSVKASSSGTYTLTFRVSSAATGAQFLVKNSSGTTLATVNVPNTGGNQTWKDITAKVTLPSGTQVLKLLNSATTRWNLNHVNFATGTTTTTATTTSVTYTRVEAESYSSMSGVSKEATSDASGTYDMTNIDAKDWMEYKISPATSGSYSFVFRVASGATGGKFDVLNAAGTTLASVTVPNTGSFQTWKDVTATVKLSAGAQTVMLYATGTARWNINYFKFGLNTTTTSTTLSANASKEAVAEESTTNAALSAAPNPFSDRFVLKVANELTGAMNVQLINISGSVAKEFKVTKGVSGTVQVYLSAATLAKGTYIVKVQMGDWSQSQQIIKL